MRKKKLDFESALSRLSDLADEMESDGMTLDGVMERYGEAVELAGFLRETLARHESRAVELKKTADGFIERGLDND
ncbi:MAG: exodeoxyribonuclease VII small subunit [Clostridiales bacterium]|jgi:exodeoxyribonuclease VII small subunit|nr:exodeoxyribonuclease VII small subunit [Clostridiales bacterium]